MLVSKGVASSNHAQSKQFGIFFLFFFSTVDSGHKFESPLRHITFVKMDI